MNWPQDAVVNLRSVSPGQNGWLKVVTKFGEDELKVNGVKEFGLFNHLWKDPQATFHVSSRVVPNCEGSTAMMTQFKPTAMSDQQFDHSDDRRSAGPLPDPYCATQMCASSC